MRIFQNTNFRAFARKHKIAEAKLCEAVARAERGLVDADLGGGVIKQRIARPGAGKSGGFRSLILFQIGDRAFFAYGFAKNQRENIADRDLKAFKSLAKQVLFYSDGQLQAALDDGVFIEVICDVYEDEATQ